MTATTALTREIHDGGVVRLVDYLAVELNRAGVTHLFGVGGANIEDLYDAVHRTGTIRGVVAKHEFSAVTMADGYARATRRLGVVAATSGGGAMNLVPGLAEAYASRVPVLALVGQPPTGQEGLGAFQDSSGKAGSFDAQEVFTPVSRFCARVDDADSLAELLLRAITAAQTDPKGPAVLLLPKDVQQAQIDVPVRDATQTPVAPTPTASAARLEAEALDAASAALRGAGRVLIIAGEGWPPRVRARSWRSWPDGSGPGWRSPRRQGCVRQPGPPVHRRSRGDGACKRRRLPAAGRLLPAGRHPAAGTGTRRARPGPGGHPGRLHRSRTTLRGRPRAGRKPAGRAARPGRPAPAAPAPLPGTRRPLTDASTSPRSTGRSRNPLLRRGRRRGRGGTPQDAHVFVDAGNAGASAVHLLPAPRHGRFVVAVGMGGMGYTFGAGIGAALATGQRTYVLAGDGAFFMHGMEVHTAVEYAAPVTFVIFNNNAHAMCALREELFQGGVRSDDLFARTDIAAGVAAAFPALDATWAGDAAQLRQALLRSNAGSGPAFIALDCDAREIPPFLPFLSFTESTDTESEETSDERGPVHVG